MAGEAIPEVQADAVRFYNELGEQQLTTELYFAKIYDDAGARAGIQLKVAAQMTSSCGLHAKPGSTATGSMLNPTAC